MEPVKIWAICFLVGVIGFAIALYKHGEFTNFKNRGK